MENIRKLRNFLCLDFRKQLLLLEACAYLAWARILVARPFSKVAPSLGIHMIETPQIPNIAHVMVLKEVGSAVERMSRHTFWDSKCLVRAIAGMKMLERRQIESTLYLGTAVDETGKMIAHAWLRSGSRYITGKEGMERFTVVGKFAKMIQE
jgi:hypothetical protein